jgi:hypothetical protein
MSVIALALKLMLTEGIPLEKVLATVAEMEAETIRIAQQSAFSADRRSPGARRTAKWRASQTVTDCHNETGGDASLDNKGLPHTPSKQLNPSKENPPKGGQKKGNDFPSDAFECWYAVYPRKQARGTAEQAFAKVRRDGQVTFTALMAGTERYRANPPNDPKFIPLPATWLNAGRWADEPHAEGSNGAKTHNLNDAAAALHERLLAAELQDRTLPAELRGGAIEGDAWFVPAK